MNNNNHSYAGGNRLGAGLCLLIISVVLYTFKVLSGYYVLGLAPVALTGLYLYLSGFHEMLKEKGYHKPYMIALAFMNIAGVVILACLPDKGPID
ncbi:MAG: hypothetical protein NE330_18480 [Lentisphaeraceae bacterium]|nr:hypothetical protein [Lentisphaeraceae bacterium]